MCSSTDSINFKLLSWQYQRGGSVKVIACIKDQDIIDRILAHLRDKEQGTPTLPHLAPPTRAPPATLSLFAGKGAR